MSNLGRIVHTLSAVNFSPTYDLFTITDLPRPDWIHADRMTITIEQMVTSDIKVDFGLVHHATLMKFGTDQPTVRSMKVLCNEEWFPDIKDRFAGIAQLFGLQWQADVDIDDDVMTSCDYSLTGIFPTGAIDRITALVFAIRAILQEG